MDSMSQRGAMVLLPEAPDWQHIELVHDGVVEESNAELQIEYALPEHFMWRFSYLGPDMATMGLDVEGMDDAWCHARAKSGAIKDLTALAEWRPALAWYWLIVAEDFGHDTDTTIDDLENSTSLHYDHDAWNWVLLDLIEAYCNGDVVERNLHRAAAHLETYLESGPIDELEALLERLDDQATELVESKIGKAPFRRIRHQLRRLERLHALNAPAVILQNEAQSLEDEVVKARTLLSS